MLTMNLRNIVFPIITPRLSLRPFAKGDFAEYAAYHSLPSVYSYLYSAPPAGDELRKQFSDVLDSAFENDADIFRLAVVRKDDDAVVGEVLLKLASKAALQGEVGYIFNPTFSGKGYATEAVSAMIDLGFSGFGFHRIFARLDTRNAGSVGVVERLGLRREAHLIQNDRFNGVWGDEYIYAMLASEWKSPTTPASGDETIQP
jgi:RimJ/RimL family protein N-acetyltransferase